MTNKAFVKKNSEDFEANTLAIEEALQAIEQNKKLKPTISQLTKMTGIHRNTLSNRLTPIQRLKQIKQAREIEKKSQNSKDNSTKINPLKILEEKVNNLQIEVIHWFNEYQDLKLSHDHMQKQYKQLKESQQYYKNLCESNKHLIETNKVDVEEVSSEPLSFQPTETKQ